MSQEEYQEALEAWENERDEHYADNWEEYANIQDIADFLCLNRKQGSSAQAIKAMMDAYGWLNEKDPLGFLRGYFSSLIVDLDEEWLKTIVCNNHYDDMMHDYERDNLKPLTPEEQKDAYEDDRYHAEKKNQ